MADSPDIKAQVESDETLSPARNRPIDDAMLREKLGRLGGTPFELNKLVSHLDGAPMVPMAMLNQLRRELVAILIPLLEEPRSRVVDVASGKQMLEPIVELSETSSQSEGSSVGSKLAVLCRTLTQLTAACDSKPELVYADFHDVREYKEAIAIANEKQVPIGLATIRMQKPGEMGLLRVLGRHRPDLVLARNLAAVDHCRKESIPVVADFSLNVSNHRSAQWIHDLGVERLTVSYDLNREQVLDLVDSVPPSWMEIVIHQHMPMFHMEHCVFCSVLSPGTNKTNCGRPCDDHVVQLRDRVGAEHTLQADVACRNTLYNATPQSGSEMLTDLQSKKIQWYRVELLEESAPATTSTLQIYRRLLEGQVTGSEVLQQLKATNRVGVTRGTLESSRNPLAIL
jgi:putative protease